VPIAVLLGLALISPLVASLSRTQAAAMRTATQSGSAPLPTPQWEIDAGGKMAFDVASVKQDLVDPTLSNMHQNVTLDAGNAFVHTGGLFSATNIPLHWYMRFAYKLTITEFGEIMDDLPKWALTNRYDIEARASGDPTKDQYRLMMQALLAERFKLAVHFETKQMPVLALMLDKPGKLGPKLRQHSEDVLCPNGIAPEGGPVATIAGGFPLLCGALFQLPSSADGHFTGGARNVPMSKVAEIFSIGVFRTGKPVVDKTDLAGNYDFLIDFSMIFNNVQADPNGSIFPEALKDQLGLKLVPQTAPVDTIVVDHIEQPSAN
jgi:uncharacterized protein (TIGR03435 family)